MEARFTYVKLPRVRVIHLGIDNRQITITLNP